MARVSLVDVDAAPELNELAARLRGGRQGRMINIYRMLLHSPPIAEGWFDLVNAVRWQTELDGKTREIAIMRVGHLNAVDYVLAAHHRYSLEEGLTEEQCAAFADWEPSNLFDAQQRSVLALTDAMTKDVHVPEAVFDELRRHFSERQIVELTVLIGTYNLHTRVLAALQIDPEPPAG
jgi:alkylhydroperoxidase family enzyme